jgi:hypothetical protein
VTKELGCCSQYSDYNIGWTALILIFCEGQYNFFFFPTKHPAQFWGAPSLLFNESQQYICQGVKLTTCLYLASRLKMSVLLLSSLKDFILCTGTTVQFLHMTAQFQSTLSLNPTLVGKATTVSHSILSFSTSNKELNGK